MVPANFANFFLACAGAGGALVGLLFVAVSINPDRTFGKNAPRERQAVAASAYTALVNAFFVSIGALIPGTNLGILAALFGVLGILNTARVGADLLMYLRHRHSGRALAMHVARGLSIVAVTLVLYGYEGAIGYDLIQHTTAVDDVYFLCGLLLGIYGVGLVRAWELLGAPRTGIAGWLNPLAGLDEPGPMPHAPAPSSDSAPIPPADAASPSPSPSTMQPAPRG